MLTYFKLCMYCVLLRNKRSVLFYHKHFCLLHVSHLLLLFLAIRFIYVLCNMYPTCTVYYV